MARCVTIYTDASVCGQSKAAGWACWIKYGQYDTHTASGILKDGASCSTDAELKAIANALYVALKLKADAKCFVVVTDSQLAINHITLKVKRSKRQHLKKLGKQIREMMPEGVELRVNKVKAHSKKDGARSYVNGLVDKAARRQMKQGRLLKQQEVAA